MLISLLLGACSAGMETRSGEQIAMHSVDKIVKDDVIYPIDVYDPWEDFNRSTYNFNARLDDAVMIPVVNAYTNTMPGFVRTGVSNFFSNIDSVVDTVNSALQLRPRRTANNGGRLLVNSTLGVLGLFDVATLMDLPKMDEDFGQTLGYWGVAEGPYIVLPFWGPSNLRDTGGLTVDAWVTLKFLVAAGQPETWEWVVPYTTLWAIDARYNVGFRYYEMGSPYEYELVRRLYKTYREIQIKD